MYNDIDIKNDFIMNAQEVFDKIEKAIRKEIRDGDARR